MHRYFLVMTLCLLVTSPLEFFLKANVYRRIKIAIKSIWLPALVYLIWDVIATYFKHWSFSPEHTSNIKLLGLPLEEYSFFIIIPLCALLTFEAVRKLAPKIVVAKLSYWYLFIFGYIIVGLVIYWIRIKPDNLEVPNRIFPYYFLATLIAFLFVTWLVSTKQSGKVLVTSNIYFITIVICLIFMIFVNGALTILNEPVVSYRANIGVRLFLDIPFEDFFYGSALLTWVLYRWNSLTGPLPVDNETKL